jgi:formylglycine-generating enzyme required for sulfatase activity
VNVSWYDAVLYCNWLSGREGREPYYRKEGKEQIKQYDDTTREYDAWQLIPAANGYRLPTEDEWEYACRAWTTTAFAFGDDEDMLERYAVYARNQRGSGPNQVGSKLCNAWGLFDMHGNVWEWCQDWNVEGSIRVNRGGGWDYSATNCRSAFRFWNLPVLRDRNLGFRVAAVPSSK